MKQLLLTFIFAVTVIFYFSSCEKETVYKDVIVEHYDTVRYYYRDTVFIVEKGDSIQVGFTYTTSYSSDSSRCSLRAGSNCKNLPSNAQLTWSVNGGTITENETYYAVGFDYNQNGNKILSLNVYLPDKKRNYMASEVVQVNTKKP